jgi:hypothetical protein
MVMGKISPAVTLYCVSGPGSITLIVTGTAPISPAAVAAASAEVMVGKGSARVPGLPGAPSGGKAT